MYPFSMLTATDLLPDMPQDVTSTVVVATEAVVHHAAVSVVATACS